MNNTKNSTVYISNLSYERDRNGLKSMFSKFGIIKNIKIVVEPTTNQSRGMAFVEMATTVEAKNAIDALNLKVFDGRTVKARWATPQKPENVDKKFYPAKVADKTDKKPAKKVARDLDFKSIQLEKKARNEAKRKSNPLVFKAKAKTKTK
jgi:RNA recognition motif-containing protein